MARWAYIADEMPPEDQSDTEAMREWYAKWMNERKEAEEDLAVILLAAWRAFWNEQCPEGDRCEWCERHVAALGVCRASLGEELRYRFDIAWHEDSSLETVLG